jgi:hypothetical protein
MNKLIFPALLIAMAGMLLAESAQDFVGTWKSNPPTPEMSRKLELQNGVIIMHETQANGQVIVRKYPTDGSTVTMDEGIFKGATATGKMEGNTLTVDTVMTNGAKFHDEWILSADGKTYTNKMVISGMPARGGRNGGQAKGGDQAKNGGRGRGRGRGGPISFSFTKVE